jgi:hypothetical protein
VDRSRGIRRKTASFKAKESNDLGSGKTDIVITDKCKVVPVLNYVSCHEDVLGEWRYSSTHSLTSAALPPVEEPPEPIG